MLRHLLESAPSRQRTRSAAIISFTIHAALVGSAIAATRIDPGAVIIDPQPARPIYIPARPQAPTAPRPRTPEPSPPVAPTAPNPIVIPVVVPTTLPPIPDGDPVPREPWPAPIGVPGDPSGNTGDPGAPIGPDGDGEPMWLDAVERPARPLGAVRQPRYPEPLRVSRIDGTVIASFVVDTLGRVEPNSFKALNPAHPLFAQAVRAAVMAQRFRAAEWRGHRVRQLVEQRFVFRLDR